MFIFLHVYIAFVANTVAYFCTNHNSRAAMPLIASRETMLLQLVMYLRNILYCTITNRSHIALNA